MSLIDVVRNYFAPAVQDKAPEAVPVELRPGDGGQSVYYVGFGGLEHFNITVDTARKLSTVYRCMNIISDDIASLPFQAFTKLERGSARVKPDGLLRNIAFLLEVQPNRWLTPFLFKKGLILDLLSHGNAYIWKPVSAMPELFPLEPRRVTPYFDRSGERFFRVQFENGKERLIPDAEILHVMINPDKKRMIGRSVLGFAADTLDRQLMANRTRSQIQGNGLLPTAALRVNADLDPEARAIVKKAYIDAAEGGVVVMDAKIASFEHLTMKATDVQFLESIQATEKEIANFFGVPEYKLNLGKQSYQSNEQQQLDYLGTTINPYLVQIEQAARLKWLDFADQADKFFRFERKALMQIDSKTQSEFIQTKIMSGIYSPNEARAIDDLTPYAGGDERYIQSSMAEIRPEGLRIAIRDSGEVENGKE